MIADLPLDNAYRQEVAPLMGLISDANRLRMVNRALGTGLTNLDSLPVDFVAAVVAWAPHLKD